MKNSQTDITTIISNEIKNKSLDLAIDYSDIVVEQFIKGDILVEIPVVKSIIAFYNIKKSIVDRHKVKKILTFFQEFNNGKIEDIKYNQFIQKFNTDEDYKNQVVETILLLNERFLQVEKSKILANLILAHINEKLSWEELTNVCVILDVIHPYSYSLLKEMSDKPNWSMQTGTVFQLPKEPLLVACGIINRRGSMFKIDKMGQQLYEFGLKPSGL